MFKVKGISYAECQSVPYAKSHTVESKDKCILHLYILTPNSVKRPAPIGHSLGSLHSPVPGDLQARHSPLRKLLRRPTLHRDSLIDHISSHD